MLTQWQTDRRLKHPETITNASFLAGLEAVLRAHERWLQTRKQNGHPSKNEYSSFSQNGEDGILESILDSIGLSEGVFWEFGAADGCENCTRFLAEKSGWAGLWVEGDVERANKARSIGKPLNVETIQAFITAENIMNLVAGQAKPNVLVIDVDGNDYWLWRELGRSIRPELVIIETNNSYGPDTHWVMPYNANHQWQQDRIHGASLRALMSLGDQFGYKLVANDSTGTNAFFVREDFSAAFPSAGDRTAHFAPALHRLPDGHPWPSPQINFSPLTLDQIGQLRVQNIQFQPKRESGYFVVTGEIQNITERWIPHVGPYPVHVGWSWGTELEGDAARATLPAAIAPGQTMPFAIIDKNPSGAAEAISLSVVQEGVGWAHLQENQKVFTFFR